MTETIKFEVSTTVPGFISSAEIISKLRAEFHGVTYDVSTPTGMAKAVEARRKLREARVALDKKKPEVKREALDFCNKVEADYKMLRAAVSEYEDIPDAAIKAEEERKEEIKREKERQAAEAQKVLDDKILEIAKLPLRCSGQSSEWVAEFLGKLEAKEIGGEFTGETRTRAEQAKAEAVNEIRIILQALAEAEVTALRLKAEQEAEAIRLEAERKEQERLAAIQREEFEKKQAELAEQKRIQDEKDAAFRKEQEAFRLEQERVNAERAEADRIEREKREALAAEEKRKQDEALAAEREKERIAALNAETLRKAAEKEKKEAEKARKLALAKLSDATSALKKILAICESDSGTEHKVEQIAIIAEANI